MVWASRGSDEYYAKGEGVGDEETKASTETTLISRCLTAAAGYHLDCNHLVHVRTILPAAGYTALATEAITEDAHRAYAA